MRWPPLLVLAAVGCGVAREVEPIEPDAGRDGSESEAESEAEAESEGESEGESEAEGGDCKEPFWPFWARWVAGTGSISSTDLASAAPEGGFFVVGYFSGEGTFGPGESGETTLVAASDDAAYPDVFLARYDGGGNLVWVRSAGGDSDDRAFGVSATPDGGAVIAGYFVDSATFGAGESGETTLVGADGEDGFVARYGDDGTLAWVRVMSGLYQQYAGSVAAGADGAVYATGYFLDATTFGAGESGETTLVTPDIFGDTFLARYEDDGSFAWVAQAGGSTDIVHASHVVVTADEGLRLEGVMLEDVTFDAGGPAETTIEATGVEAFFVARYEADSAFTWARLAGDGISGAPGQSLPIATAAAPDGSLLVAGEFWMAATFGSGGVDDTLGLESWGGYDMFLARYEPGGELAWVRQIGGSGNDEARGVAIWPDWAVLVTGYTQGEATVGAGLSCEIAFPPTTAAEVLLAAYDAEGQLIWARRDGGPAMGAFEMKVASTAAVPVVVGTFFGTATFETEENGEVTFDAGTSPHVFILAYQL